MLNKYQNSNNINLNLDARDYKFQIETRPNGTTTLHDFQFFYDYATAEGTISFHVDETGKNLQMIKISQYNNSGIIFNQCSILKENRDLVEDRLINENECNTGVELRKQDTSLENTSAVIKFKGNSSFTPSGTLIINVYAKAVHGKGLKTILLNLGNYMCVSPCVVSHRNATPVEIIGNMVNIGQPENYDMGNFQQGMTLNTQSEDQVRKKLDLHNLSISLLVSGFIFSINFVMKFFLVWLYLEDRSSQEKTDN